MRAGVMMWVKADWHRRRRSILLLALFVGLASGVALTAVVGARRTATSLERLADRTRTADVLLDVGAIDEQVVQEITRLPMVDVWGATTIVYAIVEGVDSDLAITAPLDDRAGIAVERGLLLRGRLPNPTRADEMAVSESAANLAGVDVGDQLSISTMTPEQVRDEDYDPALGPVLSVHIVGVVREVEDLAPTGADGGVFIPSEAWLPTVRGQVSQWTTYLGIGLVDGTSAAEFSGAVEGLVPPGQRYQVVSFEERSAAARRTISTLASGLAIFAIVAGAAVVLIVGQALSRHVAMVRSDQQILGHLGFTRTERCTALIVSMLPVALGGAVIAGVGSWLASPLLPIGLARRADPDLGLFADWRALWLGAFTVVAVTVGAATMTAIWMTRSQTSSRVEPAPSKLAESVGRAGGGAVLTNGVRLALDRRSPGLPVRSAVAGVALALAGVFGALSFSSSLDRLSETPERWGYGWDLLLNFTSGNVDAAVEQIASDPRLTAVARWDAGFTFVEGSGTQAYGLAPVKGNVEYSLRSGRQPLGPSEVVLGWRTAERLGVRLGEQINVAKDSDSSPQSSMLVVGTALFPDDGVGSFNDAIGFYGDAFAEHAIVPDLFEASQLVVRIAPGLDVEEAAQSLNETYPKAADGSNLPIPPAIVANLTNIRTMPSYLAAFVVLLGVGSLLHVMLVTGVRRRSELAILRSIGLTSRQTTACLIWQAITITAVGLIVGLPLGVALGDAAWFAVADPIGVATDAAPPPGTFALAAGLAVVAAVLVAWAPARRAGRPHPAESLRVE